MTRIFFLLIFYFYMKSAYGYEHNLLGCFKNITQSGNTYLSQIRTVHECNNNCFKNYYRYTNYYNGHCNCGNYLGEQITNITCDIYCLQATCDSTIPITNVYHTGNLVPGPPSALHINNITSSSCRIFWKEPESFITVMGYIVKAIILKTFSNYPPNVLAWSFGNNTFQTEISNLLSATTYNISVYAVSNDGNGATVYQIITTKLADPDNLPQQPTVIRNDGGKMTVKLLPVINNNGPVTAYRVIIVKSDDNQGFQRDNVMSYAEAQKNGLSYYITAEISPEDISKDFVVGDGRTYGQFYNVPLDSSINYNVLLALVSTFNGETKIAYSEASGYHNGISILNVYDADVRGDSPEIIIGLSIAIGLLTFMLITGIIGFIILKSRVVNRRQRLSDNQELTLQGPMIEVENNGYIHEEEQIPAISHYRSLKQKVRTIPSNQLKIEPTNLLGIGKFGRVNSGTLHENDNSTTVTCYSIYDKKMNRETKRGMLQELDVLIKTGKHENIINLVGTSETSQMVVVIMEYTTMNLKDLLLGSRDHLPGKFSNMTEQQAVNIAMGVCKGMAHLHSNNIIHKQLCARSVMILNGFTPKLGSFGLAQYFSHNKIPDYTRWTALEVFKGHPHDPKSDVWAYACLLWEICALGGTPYGTISNNNEIPEKITKGLRLPQLRYISDDLYQIMLDCWQLIPDERPTFIGLLESLENLKENNVLSVLSFNVYSNFQYEQFYPDMELSVRPAF